MEQPQKRPKKNRTGWAVIFVIVFFSALFLILAILGTVGFGMVIKLKNNLEIINYNLIMTPSQLYEAGACTDNSQYLGVGFLQIDINSNTLSYTIDISILAGDFITFMAIHGPTTSGNPKTASVFLPDDGSSLNIGGASSGQISGSLVVSRQQGNDILNSPQNYYISFTTHLCQLGAAGTRLGVINQINT